MTPQDDRSLMALALRLAARGCGQTSPNPMVGALVVARDGAVVGLGYHARAGEPHAEVRALGMAGPRARGATLYCTLEPCAHVGRTGPCCVAVADAGIARVVVATRDPNPVVAGRGLAYLRERGVEVAEGVLAPEAARLNAPFFTAMTRGRPWVVGKMATSLDGRIAAMPGVRTALTSAPANRLAHRLRAEVDAIAVGSETVLVDDPILTVRGVWRGRPLVRVIFDTRLRTPPRARVLASREAGPVWIVTTAESRAARPERAAALEAAGAELLTAPRYDIRAALGALAAREVQSLLIEGGPMLMRAAWNARVVDRVWVCITPVVLGRSGVPLEMPQDFSLSGLDDPRVLPVGPDVLVQGDVHRID